MENYIENNTRDGEIQNTILIVLAVERLLTCLYWKLSLVFHTFVSRVGSYCSAVTKTQTFVNKNDIIEVIRKKIIRKGSLAQHSELDSL